MQFLCAASRFEEGEAIAVLVKTQIDGVFESFDRCFKLQLFEASIGFCSLSKQRRREAPAYGGNREPFVTCGDCLSFWRVNAIIRNSP